MPTSFFTGSMMKPIDSGRFVAVSTRTANPAAPESAESGLLSSPEAISGIFIV